MATHGERLAEVETDLKNVKGDIIELRDHIEKVPDKIEKSKNDAKEYTDTKLAGQGNAILVKFMTVVGGLMILQTIVQAYWLKGG